MVSDAELLPPKLELEDAADILMKELDAATVNCRFHSEGNRPGRTEAQLAVINFLARRHTDPALAFPFLRLRQALADLEKNHLLLTIY